MSLKPNSLSPLDMKLFFAGATHAGPIRVREQIVVTLKCPKSDIVMRRSSSANS
jgi:hypothetical protein